nr:hypothetical protein [Tanacetum cinerariifolium]
GNEVRQSKGESDEEETRQEEKESFDPIPRTPEESEEESNDEEDQDLRLSEEARIQEDEDADELYRNVNINQGRGLQVTQNVEDSHVTLTPVNPDGPQESSSMSSFMTSMLNPISDVGVDSIFTTASSLIVSLQTPMPIMTPSTIATITTSSKAGNILLRAVREAVQIQTDRLQDSLQRENDEFLRNIDENMKKIIKGQVKNQVKEQVSLNLSEMELKKILIEKMEGNNEDERMMIRKDPPLDQTRGLKDKKKEVSKHQLALHLKKKPRVQADLPQGLNLDKCLPGRKRKQFYGYAVNRESARDVYSKRRIITITELQIMEWHDYKHLDWILVRRDDDQ